MLKKLLLCCCALALTATAAPAKDKIGPATYICAELIAATVSGHPLFERKRKIVELEKDAVIEAARAHAGNIN